MIFEARRAGSVFNALICSATLIAFLCALTTAASAQAPAAGSNWDHLKALPVHTRLHVSADTGGATCYLLSVTDAALLCGRHTFQRAEVKSVKLTRYGISYASGAGIGAAAGVAVGIGVAGGKDSFFGNDKGEFAAAGAGIGAGLGLLITGPGDLFRGPTVYRR